MAARQSVRAEPDSDDEAQYDDPVFNEIALAFNFHDLAPPHGFCLPPFVCEREHCPPIGRDVRDDPTFTTYYVVISDVRYAGGVYTNRDSMFFSFAGIDPKPDWKLKESWPAAVAYWQIACRLGLHRHALPDDTNLPPLPMSPFRTQPSTNTRRVYPAAQSPRREVPAISSARRQPSRAPSSPSTPTASRETKTSSVRHIDSTPTPVFPPTRPVRRGYLPVTPSRTHESAAGTSSATKSRARGTPSSIGSASPAKLLFASRGSTPQTGILTQNPIVAEEMLEQTDEVFFSGANSAFADAVKYVSDKRQAQFLIRALPFSPAPAYQHQLTNVYMAKKAKKSEGDPSRHRRGPSPWGVGTKATFLRRRYTTWLALGRQARGPFLDNVTNDFIAVYGMFFDIKTDLPVVPDDPEPGASVIDYDQYEPEERERAQAYTKGLRAKIGTWYREEHTRVTDTTKAFDISTLWNAHIQAQAQKKPSNALRLLHYYSLYHYDDRIKDRFELAWATADKEWKEKCAAWEDEGIPIPEDEKEPHPVAVRTKVTQECWAREPESFQVIVRQAHEQYKEDRRISREAPAPVIPDQPKTPEAYQQAINNAPIYLQPTSDTLASNTGLICAVLLCGPLPSEGGEIGMLSMHTGSTLGPHGLQWPDADRSGFAEVERILIKHAKKCFTKDQCLARALDNGAGSHMTAAPSISPSDRSVSPERQPLMRLIRGSRPQARSSSSLMQETPSERTPSPSRQGSPEAQEVSPRASSPSVPEDVVHGTTPSTSAPEAPVRGASSSPASVPGSREASPTPASSPQRRSPAPHTPRRTTLVDDEDIEKGRSHPVWSLRSTGRWSLHIRDLFDALHRARTWGFSFASAVDTFLQLEDHLDYPRRDDGRPIFAGSLRPSPYSIWARQGASYYSTVDIGDIDAFGRKFWLWWEALQPVRRVNPDGGLIAVEDFEGIIGGMEAWDGLDKCCGKDGLIQVLLLLLWWGDAINDGAGIVRPEQWLEWDMAVQDFRGILSLMMRTPGFEKVARKRARSVFMFMYTLRTWAYTQIVIGSRPT
ncbi:hypothetical protein HDZ31DRAFT_46521 [Schizophyllum fasciatum]